MNYISKENAPAVLFEQPGHFSMKKSFLLHFSD